MIDESGMSLDQYVEESLLAVIGGVLKAQRNPECGAYVGRSPTGDPQHLTVSKDAQDNVVALVKFDLATTVETKAGAQGGVAIKVIPFLQAKADGTSAQTHR